MYRKKNTSDIPSTLSSIQVFCTLYLLISLTATTVYSGSCLSFRSPATGETITSSVCTLSVDYCREPNSLIYQVYMMTDKDGRYNTEIIARKTEPPFTAVWEIPDSIPLQTFKGITVSARGYFTKGYFNSLETEDIHQEGIFVMHKRHEPPVYEIHHKNSEQAKKAFYPLFSEEKECRGFFNISHTRKMINVTVEISDKSFQNSYPESLRRKLGASVLIDPDEKDLPYPDTSVYRIFVPLKGKAEVETYKPVYASDGNFSIDTIKKEIDCFQEVTTEDHKGYTIEIGIDKSLLAGDKKENVSSFGVNVFGSLLTEKNTIARISAIQGGKSVNYSPVYWIDATIMPLPVHANWWFAIPVSFLGGFLLSCIVFRMAFKQGHKEKDEEEKEEVDHLLRTDEGSSFFHKIREIIEENVQNPEFGFQDLSLEIGIGDMSLKKRFKELFMTDFESFLQYCRVELAKERLRSVNFKLSTIRKNCGFRSGEEMFNAFMKYTSMDPEEFRDKNTVV